MEDISQASVQSDSSRDALLETPASDSDSGDSLFVTQSVTSALRNVKRHRPSNTQACPFRQESEDKQETVQHEKNGTRSDSDSEASYADLHQGKPAMIKSTRRHRRPRSRRVAPKRMALPFLKSDSGKLCVRGNQTIVNSELGGFFKCILKLNNGCKENRRELSPSILPSEVEQNHEDNDDDDDDDDEDIRKVNPDFFIYGGHKRIRQTWQPFLKWKTIQDPRKCTKKSKKCQEEWEKSYQTRQVAEDPMEPQDDTDVRNENSLFNIEESQSWRMGEGSSKFPASPSLSPCSTPSCLSPEKSLFVQNLFMDRMEKHTENSQQVLVTCSQSQSVDRHQAEKIDKTFEKRMEPIDEMAVEETRWPCSADKVSVLLGKRLVLCLKKISTYDLQGQSKDICQSVHHDTVDNEDLVSASGGFISSQDLFQEPNNQASPLKETDVENANEKMKNCVLLHDDTDSLMKNKRCSSTLADVEGDTVKYSKSLSTTDGDLDQARMEPIDEMAVEETRWPCSADKVSVLLGKRLVLCLEKISSYDLQGQSKDICQGVHHDTVDNEDFVSASGGFISSQDLFQEPNNQASPLKETDVENANEKMKNCVLLHDDTDSLLKNKRCSSILADVEGDNVKYSKSLSTTDGDLDQARKENNKKTSDNSVEHVYPSMPLKDYTTGSRGSNYSSPSKDLLMVRQKEKTESPLFKYGGIKFLKRKKGKVPEISHNLSQVDPGQNEDHVPHFNDDVKQKKRKKVKNVGLLEEPVNTLPEISVSTESCLSVQDSSVVCASVSENKPKRKKDKYVGLLEEPVVTPQEISVSADPGLSVQYSSVVCASVSGSKPKKKRKKDKNVGLLEEPVVTPQEISVSADFGLSDQDSSVVCASVSGSKPKKKRKKDKNVGLLEEPVVTPQEISVSADFGLSDQDSSVVCASVSGSKPKKKRKKDKNVGLSEEPVGTLHEISVSADPGLSDQDSSVVCASVSGSKPKKKRKKDKNVGLLEEPVVTPQEISVSADFGLSDQDSSVVCASVSGSKPKKKRKKDKNVGLSEEPVGTLHEISVSADPGLSVQDSSVVCASVSGSKPKRRKDKNVGLSEEAVGTLHEISVSANFGLSDQDSSVICASVSGSKPKKKRKKGKNVGLLEEPVVTPQEISVSADFGLSDQDSSVICASVSGSKPKKKRKKDKNVGLLEEPVGTLHEISVSADPGLSVQDSSVVCASVSGSKPKRKKDKNVGLSEEPVGTLHEISVSADPGLSDQDSSVICASVSGSKPKKKRKKDKNVGLLEEPVVTPQEISVSADFGLSDQDSSGVCASVSGSKLKKKRKKDKYVGLLEEPVGTLHQINVSADFGLSVHDSSVVCASIPCQGSAYLVSIAKETELLTGNDLFIPEVNQLDIGAQAHKDHVQHESHEPPRKKKKKTKKRDTSPVISEEMVAPKSSKESHLNHCTKTVKKKKQKFIYDVGESQVAEMFSDSQNIGEPFKKILKIPAGIEIQPANNIDLMTDETVTPKKKRRKRQDVVREENVDVEASFVETTEQVQTLDTFQDSVQQAAEVVQVKKQKKKKDRTVTCHEEEVFKNSTVSIGLGDTTTSKTPNNNPETGGIDKEEGLGESEPVKKKKKKRK
ncbi:phoenix [Tachysurus fulvidraco]|uniref:phoenix n=1 Tax=Tachysurus fulvidraco TaxID=1234273 RepID=UPI001FF0773D|nr:phoenix [Tachysurus fulvidraco]